MNPIVIIGSGLAGYSLAKEFRKYDTKTPLYIITKSNGEFYSKPLLSTALTNKRTATTLPIATAQQMAKQLNATILTQTAVTKVDVQTHSIYFNQQSLVYSKLVLACGAEVVKPDIAGSAEYAIQAVNDLEDYAKFQQKIAAKKQIAVLGAGLVGCEFANDLSNSGYQVLVIAPDAVPLARWAPAQIGKALQQALAEQGVDWQLEQTVKQVDATEKGYVLTLSNQQQYTVDAVLSAIGLRPHTQLAINAGITVKTGIVVDRSLRTSADDVYALGDCAEVNGVLMFFVTPLLQCTKVLAKTLAGELTLVDYPAMPIIIKTPACPITILPPARGTIGEWQVSGNDKHIKALFYNSTHQLCGFALSGNAVREKVDLIKQIPALF